MPRENNHPRCDVAVLVDEEVGEHDASGRFVVERGSMEAQVLQALTRQSFSACVVPFDPAITPTVETLRALSPRVVFNLTEWIAGDRRLDAAIAGVLEMMSLRYTGAGPDGMQLARDKAIAKSIVADLGIAVPDHVLVNGRLPAIDALAFPVILKPQFGDGSDGLAASALARNPRQLSDRVAKIRRRSDEALLCEEYVAGRDLFVGMLGNEPRVMPPLELVVGRSGAGAPRFATFSIKNDAAYRRKWAVRYRRAALSAALLEEIEDASRRIFSALKLRDYARIDYRLTPEERLVFLEANPNPDLTRHTFGRDVCFAGVPYADLISGIVSSALARPK
jgi:D-alanine-D-alanine ligase